MCPKHLVKTFTVVASQIACAKKAYITTLDQKLFAEKLAVRRNRLVAAAYQVNKYTAAFEFISRIALTSCFLGASKTSFTWPIVTESSHGPACL